jgi:hypothetical protein
MEVLTLLSQLFNGLAEAEAGLEVLEAEQRMQ